MAEIALQGVSKLFRDGTEAVHEVDLEVPDGELMVLVGPSGCGKTTLLRMVAGLEDATSGTIWIGDRVVNDVPPGERDVAMVFQNYALYRHFTVYQNMALSLKIRRIKKPEIQRRVREAAEILRLEELLSKSPRELSGGQGQRVAMGRALVREPRAFLMDEPLSNLDAKLRVEMRTEILRIQRDLRVTTIYVTHDQTEAMTLGDRVAVLRRGILQQLASPQELYLRPANLFVAGFIGSPAMNLVEATVRRSTGGLSLAVGQEDLHVPPEAIAQRPRLTSFVDRKVIVGIRPEDMEDAALVGDAGDGNRLAARVELREDMGAEAFLHFWVEAPPALTDDTRELASEFGSEKLEELREQASERRSRFVVRASPESRSTAGADVRIHVDTRKLHFFDPETGEAIGGDSGARGVVSVATTKEPG